MQEGLLDGSELRQPHRAKWPRWGGGQHRKPQLPCGNCIDETGHIEETGRIHIGPVECIPHLVRQPRLEMHRGVGLRCVGFFQPTREFLDGRGQLALGAGQFIEQGGKLGG